jgi:FAD/FMN-containing dehydrogenase
MADHVSDALRRDLEACIEGEVRFDAVTRALYSTDASVYQIEPIGAVIVKSREDLLRVVEMCARHRCPLTMRGGGTSQAGQAIGSGLQVDTSKYYNQILELNADEQWVRVQPGIVLDELNAALKSHGLRFAPDVSTASRATIGGMIANNSSGAHRPRDRVGSGVRRWLGRALGYRRRGAGVLSNCARAGGGTRG